MYNIKIYLRDIGWSTMDWFVLAQDRNQWRALSRATGVFSRRAQLHAVSRLCFNLFCEQRAGSRSTISANRRVSALWCVHWARVISTEVCALLLFPLAHNRLTYGMQI
jgi:hypothetical protein